MMNYQIFKEVVAEQFLNHMPAEFADYKVNICPVQKVNRTVDSINLIPPENSAEVISPSIYLNQMYEEYQRYGDINEVLERAAHEFASIYKAIPEGLGEIDLAHGSDRVVMMLINTEQNQEMLKEVPHRQFKDLSIVYYYVAAMEEAGIQTAQVTNSVANYMGMNEEALYQAAVENTKELLPPVVKNMNELMRDIFLADGMPAEIADLMIGELPPEQSMYVITNERRINGAASMLYENELHKLAEKLESDLYIMPSSIHEVIAVSSEMGDPNELADIVQEVNMNQVELGERLSNQVYHYDKELRKLSVATDTPNKRLDGIVAEPSLIYETKPSR